MNTQNLRFNILTFSVPTDTLTFYFSKEETKYCTRIHHTNFPDTLEFSFPGVCSDGTEFIYTSFTYPREGLTAVDLEFNPTNFNLLKQYYNDLIFQYFKRSLKQVVLKGFIDETNVWIPAPDKSTTFNIYEKYSLKIQLATVTNAFELLISYNGKSKVFKKSIAQLIPDVSPACFMKVLQGQSVFSYDKMTTFGDPDYTTAFPVLNFRLLKALNIKADAPDKGNKYLKYFDKINSFAHTYLHTKPFCNIIPLNQNAFLEVQPTRISGTHIDSNKLSFKDNAIGRIPKYDLKKLKPYKPSPYSNIHMFFIVHQDNVVSAEKLKGYIQNASGWFKGFHDYIGLMLHTESGLSIKFQNKDNPLPEIEQKLSQRIFSPDIKYIAIYVSPFDKNIDDDEKASFYFQVKELLLKRNITIQAVDAAKLVNPKVDYSFFLPNLAVAMLAKLDGIPWRLHVPTKNELIIGVGAFKHKDGVQYIGAACSFDNTGRFNDMSYFMKNETRQLAGSIEAKIKEYAAINDKPDRLIIHFYKALSQKELAPIEEALEKLQIGKIPIYIITINKTEAKDIVAFDLDYDQLMPESGTYINIGQGKYLLFNNTRYADCAVSATDGYPFPIKMAIDCTDKSKLKDLKIMNDLINQVYQFSRIYFKSIRQQNLPVTIKYPEMVAQIAPHFKNGLPEFGKKNPWFL